MTEEGKERRQFEDLSLQTESRGGRVGRPGFSGFGFRVFSRDREGELGVEIRAICD